VATLSIPRIELSELAERFLVAILDRLALERITELHLFEPMRQGGVETGIAVIAYDGVPDGTPVDAAGERRHTVFTARYRAVLKGAERGKWESELVNEADAPLLTVETVVRGVQRRSGDEVPPLRFDAVQLATALRRPVPERLQLSIEPDGEPVDVPLRLDDVVVADGFRPAPLGDGPPLVDDPTEWPPSL
jgi:hypothetical protein